MIGVTLELCDEVSVERSRVSSCWNCHIEGDVVRVMVLRAAYCRGVMLVAAAGGGYRLAM